MDIKEEEEIKKEFQLERVVLFSDAVFAIIITIMVLEIKLPEGIREASAEHVKEVFSHHILPKLLGYLTAFFIVGMFWIKHLKLFSYLKDYTQTLIIYNLVFLLCVSLFPFGVSVMTDSIAPGKLYGLYVYFAIIMSAIFTQTLLTGYLIRNAETLCIKPKELARNLEWKAQKINFVAVPVLFIYTTLGNYYHFPVQMYSFGFIAWALILAFARKRLNPNPPKSDGPMLARLFRSRKPKREKTEEVPAD
jgi:uncharacterized membrane protein